MKVLQYYKRDLWLGILKRIYIMLIPVLYLISEVISTHKVINSIQDMGIMTGNGTIMDYFLNATRGMGVYIFDPKDVFFIPIGWFVFEIGIAYFIAYYAVNDFNDYGKLTLTAGKSRGSFFFSKVLWCITSIILYYALTWIVVAIGALICGASSTLKFSTEFTMNVLDYGTYYTSQADIVYISIILPMFVNISLCLLEMTMAFYVSPVVSFALLSGYYIIGTYYTSPIFIGNFAMWLRSSFITEQGLSPMSGVILSLAVLVASLMVGRNYIKGADIM